MLHHHKDGIHIDPEKIQSIMDWLPQKNYKILELQWFGYILLKVY